MRTAGIAGTETLYLLPFRYFPLLNPIWLDSVNCTLQNQVASTHLGACDHRGINVTDCDHNQDVILSCLTEGSVRLVTSDPPQPVFSPFGRLEVYINGLWGTVCDNNFTSVSADVICRQMGLEHTEVSEVVRWTSVGEQK